MECLEMINCNVVEKFDMQDNQYSYPYHYIPYIDQNGIVRLYRDLFWGYEYFCYLIHIKEIIESISPQTLLDIGCGDGRLINLVAKNIKRSVGVDLSSRAIKFAQAFNTNKNTEFLEMDAKYLNGEFDLVTAIEVLEHISDEDVCAFLNTIANHVRVGGKVIISVPTTVVPLHKKHYRHYNIMLLEEQLKQSMSGLKIIEVNYVYKEDFLFKIMFKLKHNRFWFINIKLFQRLIWNYVIKKLRFASDTNGRHMIVILEK